MVLTFFNTAFEVIVALATCLMGVDAGSTGTASDGFVSSAAGSWSLANTALDKQSV